MRLSTKQNGFTIVEILIVVVIIAILASLSVTVYAGVQTRATNSQILSAVSQWERILKSYKTIKGSLPLSDYNCLANATTDFPAGNGMSAGECMHGYAGSPTFSAVYSSALTSDLKGVLAGYLTLPSGKTPVVTGIIWATQTPISTQGFRYNNQAIEYCLLGKGTSCGKGTVGMVEQATDTLTFCSLDLNAA